MYIYFLLFEENHQNRISRVGEKISPTISFFFRKMIALVLKLSCYGLRIEHLCDIIPKAQSWLVLNLPVFMFVYIHFNVPPDQNRVVVVQASNVT